MIMWIVDFK